MTRLVYTDGACSGNPGPGGWAWVEPDVAYGAGHAAHSTNQRMEIKAAYEAVQSIEGPLEVRSDSTYVVNCFRDGWWEGWLKRGWKNSQKKPVANRDLWEPFIELVRDRGDVEFTWVKGHSGDEWNDVADRLAVQAMTKQCSLSGAGVPADLGPADDIGPEAFGGRRDERPAALAGHALLVVGHRIDGLGGPEGTEGSLVADVRQRLGVWFERRADEVDNLVVVTGLRLGTELEAAAAAFETGVPYVAVLPFPDPASAWSAPDQLRFAELLRHAEAEILLNTAVPDTPQGIAAAVAGRDEWLGRNVDEAVLVWDGIDERIGRLYRVLHEQLDDEVLVLDPAHGRTAPAGDRDARRRSGQ